PRRPTRLRLALRCAAGLAAFLIARSIVGYLPVAQRQVERLGLGLVDTGQSGAGLSPHARLGALASLKLSRVVALRVWSSAPRKLRGCVYTSFDGRSWHAVEPPDGPRRLVAIPLASLAPDL